MDGFGPMSEWWVSVPLNVWLIYLDSTSMPHVQGETARRTVLADMLWCFGHRGLSRDCKGIRGMTCKAGQCAADMVHRMVLMQNLVK